MAIRHVPVPMHWQFFLSIEEDLFRLARAIEFAPCNFACYSIDLARLLMSAAAEVDVVAKLICQRLDPTSGAETINAYQRVLCHSLPGITSAEVYLPRFGLTLAPWSNWSTPETPPEWWTANNKVKHQRSSHYARASLANCLNAIAALFVIALTHDGHSGNLLPAPSLFLPGEYGHVNQLGIVYIGVMEAHA